MQGWEPGLQRCHLQSSAAPNTKRSGGRSLEGGGGAAPEEGRGRPGGSSRLVCPWVQTVPPKGARQKSVPSLSCEGFGLKEREVLSPHSTHIRTHNPTHSQHTYPHVPIYITHIPNTYTHTHTEGKHLTLRTQTLHTPHTQTHRLTHPHYTYRHTYLRQTVCLTFHTQTHNPTHSSHTNSQTYKYTDMHTNTHIHTTHYTYISTKHQQTMTHTLIPVQFSQSCLTLGFPGHHQLPEPTQTRVH